MALPISPGEIYAVAKYAYDLWQSCKVAEDEFRQIGREILSMRTIMEVVHIDIQDEKSIINLVDNQEKTVRKQLGVYIGNCDLALKSVDTVLKRYKKMSALERLAWSFSGRAEVSSLESNLSSFVTQLDSYLQKLELKGLAMINKKMDAGFGRLGRFEDLFEKYNGDKNATVTKMVQESQSRGGSQRDRTRFQSVMTDYANEVCHVEEKPRPRTPNPPRGRQKEPSNSLNIPGVERRALSAGTVSTTRPKDTGKKGPPTIAKGSKANATLECWLIQIKSGQALFLTFEKMEKEKQHRGQWKLREMAKQFNDSCETDKLKGNHDIVKWVLKDRKKHEHDVNFTWYPFAGKLERKGEVLLGMGVEAQAMVIIKRQLTPSAQRIADEKEAVKAKKAAQKAKAKIEAEKKQAAQKAKAKVEAEKKKAAKTSQEKEKKEQANRIEALEKENAKLKAEFEKSKGGSDKTQSAEGVKPDDKKLSSTKGKSKAEDKREGSKSPDSRANDSMTKTANRDSKSNSKSNEKDKNKKSNNKKEESGQVSKPKRAESETAVLKGKNGAKKKSAMKEEHLEKETNAVDTMS